MLPSRPSNGVTRSITVNEKLELLVLSMHTLGPWSCLVEKDLRIVEDVLFCHKFR
jgi:hypothetical protein